jgi:hypothetical protein
MEQHIFRLLLIVECAAEKVSIYYAVVMNKNVFLNIVERLQRQKVLYNYINNVLINLVCLPLFFVLVHCLSWCLDFGSKRTLPECNFFSAFVSLEVFHFLNGATTFSRKA